MKTDLVSRIASLFLIFLFLYNDVHASVRALNQWENIKLDSHTQPIGKRNPIANPAAQHQISSSISRPQTKTAVSQPERLANLEALASFTVSPLEESARIGMEMHMPVNDPRDDIFHFQLPEDFKSEDWASVYLSYEVKGVADGRSLAKSINSRETFGERSLEADNEWHEVQEKVAPADLQAGSNYLRFTIPNGMGLSAEVKNLRFNFNRQGDAQLQAARLERVVIDDPTYFRAVPQLESSPAYRLREVEMPALPQGIINVTAGAKAYQPSPQVAAQAELIGFKLNIGSLNSQRKLSELQVYYFDYERSAWQGVAIDSIDTQGEIAFVPNKGQTQYFGALIKSPEMPEASAFAPTMIQDIEAANPATGMNLMQPPSISQTGEARIQYPFELPGGINGMKPSLALTYSSDGGSSFVGFGWSLPQAAIQVDTRWGVPTYDANNETESYSLNGEDLFEAGEYRANRDLDIRTPGPKRFFKRIQSDNTIIERLGNTPTDYTWQVTRPDGTILRYGFYSASYSYQEGGATTNLQAADAILATASGNRAKWLLTEVEDVNGNKVVYEYQKSTATSLDANNPLYNATSIYQRAIFYTGSGNDLGLYKVSFEYGGTRVDARVSNNLGLKFSDHLRLNKVRVQFIPEGETEYNTEIRAFRLDYANDPEKWFYKTMLLSIADERNGQEFYKHDFDYFNEHEGAIAFASNPSEIIKSESFNEREFSDLDQRFQENLPGGDALSRVFGPSPLGTSSSRSHLMEGSVGLGFVPGPLFGQDKNFTISGVIGGTLGSSQGKTQFTDINADGLPDLVRTEDRGDGAKFYYYPLRRRANGSLGFGKQKSLNREGLLASSNYTFKRGFDFVTSVAGLASVTYALNWVNSSSETEKYFIDYNADGVQDLVLPSLNNKSYVYFGNYDLNSRRISFDPHSSTTLNPTLRLGAPPSIENETGEPLMGAEIVRTWKAPRDGMVDIQGTAQLTNHARGVVEIAIQKNSNYVTGYSFAAVDENTPLSTNYSNLAVSKGDLILFRVRSGENSYEDLLDWNPSITYLGSANLQDGDGNQWLNSSTSDGFLLSGREAVTISGERLSYIDWANLVIPALSDDVQLRIHIKAYEDVDPLQTNQDTAAIFNDVYTFTVPAGSPNVNVPVSSASFKNALNQGLNLLSGPSMMPGLPTGLSEADQKKIKYKVAFSVFSSSNISWNDIDWRPEVYIGIDPCDVQKYITTYPTVYFKTYNENLSLHSPHSSALPAANTRAWPSFSAIDITNAFNNVAWGGPVSAYLVLKQNQALLTKVLIEFYSNGSYKVFTTDAAGAKGSEITGLFDQVDEFFFDGNGVSSAEPLYIELYSNHLGLGDVLSNALVSLVDLDQQTTLISNLKANVFVANRGYLNDHWLQWGRFMWNDLDRVANNPINIADLEPAAKQLAIDNQGTDFSTFNQSDFDEMFNAGATAPEFKFMMLNPVRGEELDALRDYITEAAGFTSNEFSALDRYSVMHSHAAELRAPGLTSPWLFMQKDMRISTSGGLSEPSGTDVVPAISSLNKSYTLGANYDASVGFKGLEGLDVKGGLAVDIPSPLFYSHTKTSMRDYNGDGYPDILKNNAMDLHYSDPRGAINNQVTNIAPGPKNNSYNAISANVGIGSTGNELFSHTSVSNIPTLAGVYQFALNNVATVGGSASVSYGNRNINLQWEDLNGDGLPDRVEEALGGDLNVQLNRGYGLNGNVTKYNTYDRSSIRNYSISLSFSSGYSNSVFMVPPDYIEKLLGKLEILNKSFSVGLGSTRSGSFSQSFFLDLNADGLPDRVVQESEASKDYEVYLNTGLGFMGPIAIGELPSYANQRNAMAINVGAHLTRAWPIGSIPPWGSFKIHGSGGYNYAYSVDFTRSTFRDMNGDGAIDMLKIDDDNNIEVYYNQFGKSLKLKEVTNPLNGNFTIDYKTVGNKYGYYAAQITSHKSPEDEDVFWDMPNTKWVMSSLEVYDGVDVVDGSEDLDGADYRRFSFHYDGGVKSRRERKFLGFSRVEKRFESLRFESADYKDISDPDHVTFYNSGCYEVNEDETYAEKYYSEVVFYESLIGNSFTSRKVHEYKHGLVKHLFYFLNYKTTQTFERNPDLNDGACSTAVPFSFKEIHRYKHPISHKELRYDYFSVNSQSGFVNRLETDDLEPVVFEDISESATVFPALSKELVYVYPEIDTTAAFFDNPYVPVDFVQAQVFDAEYDEKFNLIRYVQGAGNVQNAFTRVLKEEKTYEKLTEFPAELHVKFKSNANGSGLPGFDIDNPFGAVTLIPNFKANYEVYEVGGPTGYQPDTLFLPLNLLETNPCGLQPVFHGDNDPGIPVPVNFFKVETKTIQIYEDDLVAVLPVDLIADMEYHPAPASYPSRTNMLKNHEVRLQSDAQPFSRKTTSDIDNKGLITHIYNHYTDNSVAMFTTTNLQYNTLGQVVKVKYPTNHAAQIYEVDFSYDSHQKHLVTSVSNSYGESSCNIYMDNGTGLLLQTLDINGNPMRYEYDDFYRLIEVYGPNELASTNPEPIIVNKYYLEGVSSTAPNAIQVPVALSYHNVNYSPAAQNINPQCSSLIDVSQADKSFINQPGLVTISMVDGTGAVTQVKKTARYHTGSSNSIRFDVSGHSRNNIYGWPKNSRISFLEAVDNSASPGGGGSGASHPYGYANAYLSVNKNQIVSKVAYDYLGRTQTVESIEDGATTFAVLAESDFYWSNDGAFFIEDQINGSGVRMRNWKNGLGQLSQQERYPNGPSGASETTSFNYDALGQLLSYQTPGYSALTQYVYDELGRLLSEDHPDRGLSTFTYDNAGNQLSIENAESELITMEYNYSRLVKTTHSKTGDLYDTDFIYGQKNDGKNGAGKVVQVVQGSNFKTEDYRYDRLGNLVYEKKSINVPQAGVQEFATHFSYDSWGRLKTMRYPDLEEVFYSYASTGELTGITAQRNSLSPVYTLVSDIKYNGFGQINEYLYGNQARTIKNYDQNTRRLSSASLKVKDATQSGTTILNKSFQYDVVGTITGISNTASAYTSVSGERLGGAYALQNITYDGMNQLSSLDLKYGKSPAGLSATSLDQDLQINMQYSPAGKIASKTIGALSATTSLNYELNYNYASPASGRLSSIDYDYPSAQQNNGAESFSYNSVGSISERSFTKNGDVLPSQASKYQWTEDQKLRGVLQEAYDPDGNVLNSSVHHYMYDHKGERMIKSNFYLADLNVNSRTTAVFPMETPTVYVNPYYIANHYSETVLASKHYYMGGQRIATALISYDFDPPQIPGPTEPGGEPEPQAGYSAAEDGGIIDIQQTFRLLFDLPELEISMETYQLQSIGDPVALVPCGDGSEYGENPIPEGEPQEPLSDDCACEQSLYWANEEGYNCEELNILYFYHPDYLGSVEFVTDMKGEPYQFFLNTPWGENLENQFAKNYTSFSSRFRFNGKEWDEETGNFYYGARYYDPKISVWLSVDPLAHEFPGWSSYNFTMNNPLNLVDPDGRSANPVYDTEGEFLGNTSEGFQGAVLIYSGSEEVDFSTMTSDDAQNMEEVETLNAHVNSGNFSNQAFSNIMTHIIKQFDGSEIFKGIPAFDFDKVGGKIHVRDGDPLNDEFETDDGKIYAYQNINSIDYTVENIRCGIIAHEYLSHYLRDYGEGKGHYRSYFLELKYISHHNLNVTSRYYQQTIQRMRNLISTHHPKVNLDQKMRILLRVINSRYAH